MKWASNFRKRTHNRQKEGAHFREVEKQIQRHANVGKVIF